MAKELGPRPALPLELPYVLHNVAKKSPSRRAFIARSGMMQVPWL